MASLKLNPFPPFTNCCIVSNTHQTFPKNYLLPSLKTPFNPNISIKSCRAYSSKPPIASQLQELVQEESNTRDEFEKSGKVLKDAAKTRKVPKEEVLAALSVMKKAKVDTSEFLSTLGGTESPGRTWMLIFTAKDRLKTGTYFPITAVQRFDAAEGDDLTWAQVRKARGATNLRPNTRSQLWQPNTSTELRDEDEDQGEEEDLDIGVADLVI